jgi:integrase
VEIVRPNDETERYLTAEELPTLKRRLDEKVYRKSAGAINEPFYRLRMIVLMAVMTGMRIAEIFGLKWSDLLYKEELIAVRSKLKRGKCGTCPCSPSWPMS